LLGVDDLTAGETGGLADSAGAEAGDEAVFGCSTVAGFGDSAAGATAGDTAVDWGAASCGVEVCGGGL